MEDEPDLVFAGLSLWALSRQFANLGDEDHGWTIAYARVQTANALVEVPQGAWLRSVDVRSFLDDLEIAYEKLQGRAVLYCAEPYLNVVVECQTLGAVEVTVDITPDHLTQSHKFRFGLNQSYLPPVIAACRQILRKFPVTDR